MRMFPSLFSMFIITLGGSYYSIIIPTIIHTPYLVISIFPALFKQTELLFPIQA